MLNGVTLTLYSGVVTTSPVHREVIDALTSVEVTSTAEGVSGFQLSFRLNNRSPLHNDFLIKAGTQPLLRMIIVVTIHATQEVMMDGVITNHQVSAGSLPGESILTMTGEDLSKVMDLINFRGVPFPATPSNARVLVIIAKYAMFGIIPAVVPSPYLDVVLPTTMIPAQEGTDRQYIQMLAEKTGYIFYIDPGAKPGMSKAYWGPPIYWGEEQPALNVDMDAHNNVESFNVSFNTADAAMPTVYIQNKLSKFPIPVPIPKFNPLRKPLGQVPPSVTKFTPMWDTAKLPVVNALLLGIAEAAKSADAVTASGSLDVARYGRILKARALVGVRGAGKAFDGLYFVTSVTSTLKRGGFKQSFELSRNALVATKQMVTV
jgi:hypothetical protein